MSTCNFLAPNGEVSNLYAALEQKYGSKQATKYWYWTRSNTFPTTVEKDSNGEPTVEAVENLLNTKNVLGDFTNANTPPKPMGWSKGVTAESMGYEVSSAGDQRFSALYAKLKDGRTIEEAYQLDVKGYRIKGNDWKLGKGKRPLDKNMTMEQSWNEYRKLWEKWAEENPTLIEELRKLSAGKFLTDKFANTDISQARALYEILSKPVQVRTPKTFHGKMTFDYNGNARKDLSARSTIQAIRMGERTATTRYESDGNIEYWKSAQAGDVIEFTGADGSTVLVEVIKPLTKLPEDTSAEEWSKKEGWSVEYFEQKVKPKLKKGAWQMEYKYISKLPETPKKETAAASNIVAVDITKLDSSSPEKFTKALEDLYETAKSSPQITFQIPLVPTDTIKLGKQTITGAKLVALLDRIDAPINVTYHPQMAARMQQLPQRFTAGKVLLDHNPLMLEKDSVKNLMDAFFVQIRDAEHNPTGEYFTLEKQNEAIDGIIFRFYVLFTKAQQDPKLDEKLKGKKLINYIRDQIYAEFTTQRDNWAKADRGEIPSRPKSADTAQKVIDYSQVLYAFNQRGQANGLWKFAMNKLASMGIKAKENAMEDSGNDKAKLPDNMDDYTQDIEELQGVGLRDFSDSSFELDMKDTASTRMKLFLVSTVQSYFTDEVKSREVSFSISNETTRTLISQGLKRELVIKKSDLEKKGLALSQDIPANLPQTEKDQMAMAVMPIGGKFKEMRVKASRLITADDVNNEAFRTRIKEEEGVDLEVGMVLMSLEPYVQQKDILQGERNYLNLPRLADFETLFQDLTGILANREPSYEGYVQALSESKNPNVQQVLQKLLSAEEHVKKEFVSVFSASYQRMLMVLFKKSKNGFLESRVIDSNRFNEVQTIKRFWQENQKEAEILTKDTGGNTIINRNLATAMWDELYGPDGIYSWQPEKIDFESFVNKYGAKRGLEKYEEEVKRVDKTRQEFETRKREFFEMLLQTNGIDMDPKAIDYLFKNIGKITKQIKIKSIFGGRTQEGEPIGLVDILVHRLMGAAGEEDVAREDEIHEAYKANNPLYTENTAISLLAKVQLLFTPSIYSQSHKSADGKTIYSYGLNTALSHAVRKLKEDPAYRMRYQDSPFAKNSWLLNRLTPNEKQGSFQLDRFQLVYMDGLKNEYSTRDGVTRPDMSDREQWMMLLSLFQNRNNKWNTNYVSLTHSDKTKTPVFMGAPRENFVMKLSGLGKLDYSEAIIQKLYENVFLAEYNRMMNPGGENLKGYEESKQHYYFFPWFNKEIMQERFRNKEITAAEYTALWNKDGTLQSMENPSFKPVVMKMIKEQMKKMAEDTYNSWISSGLLEAGIPGSPEYYTRLMEEAGFVTERMLVEDGLSLKEEEVWTYPNGVPIGEASAVKELQMRLAAVDYTVNSFLFNTSTAQLFYGDPALTWKGSVAKTMVEYGKRLAKDIAPGRDGEFSHAPTYTAVTIKDYEPIVKELEAIWGKSQVNATDAQEFTTVTEHLNVMYAYGKITRRQWAEAIGIIKNSNGEYYRFPKALEKLIMQPMKPVAVGLRDAVNGVMNIDYVKSSSFPLYPPAIAGMELDKLRVAMERDKIDRVNFTSARKIGSSKDLPQIFTTDGRIDEKVFEGKDWKESARQVMDRSEFRIQQEVPYDEDKDAILTVSQMNKLVVEKVATVKTPFLYRGESLNGTTLRRIKEDVRKQLIEESHQKFLGKIGARYDPERDALVFADKRKLYNLLAREAGERSGYTMNDVLALKSYYNKQAGDMLAIPLIFTPSASKFEGMLMSLVKKVVQIKMPGHSFIQASPAGFQSVATWEDSQLSLNDIVWTKEFSGELQTAHIGSNGEIIPAQVLVGFNYFTESGQRIDIQDFIIEKEGKRMLDTARLPAELFQLIGARIPNQGHSSMLPIEIVGFLPQQMGDMIVVPAAITKQMGADFDVDKLYTYHRGYAGVGNRLVVNSDPDADLLNQYFDIHWSVLTNPEMFGSMMAELDKKDASQEAELLSDADSQVPFYFSPSYQAKDFQSMKGAKVLVGQTSLALTHNALIQDKNIQLARRIVTKEGVEIVPHFIQVADKDGNLLELNVLSGYGESEYEGQTRTKADNVQIQQSESVDHAKNRVIDKINLDPTTSAASLAMSRIQSADIGEPGSEFFVPGQALSFDYNARLLMQPIVREYASLMSQANDSISTNFSADVKSRIFKELRTKYSAKHDADSIEAAGKVLLNPEKLLTALSLNPNSLEFAVNQLATLDLFEEFDELGSQLVTLQSISSQDTRGAGRDMLTVLSIESKRSKIMNKEPFFIDGAEQIFADTETGVIYDSTVSTARELYKEDLPYYKLEEIYKTIQEITGKKDELSDDYKRKIFNAARSFIFSHSDLGLFENAYEERVRLLFSTPERSSLATRVLEAKNTWGSSNYFLQRLYTNIDPDGLVPDMLEYNAAKASRLDDYENVKGWLDMLISDDPVKRKLGEDLIRYNYVTGGLQNAKNFVKYIPWAAIEGSSIATGINLQALNLETLSAYPAFIEQIFQHNPNLARQISNWESQTGTHFDIAPESFILPTLDVESEDSNPAKDLIITISGPDGPYRDYPPYLSVREGNKMLLYKKKPMHKVGNRVVDGMYQRIDTLGDSTTGLLEYQATGAGEARSVNYDNRASGILELPSQSNMFTGNPAFEQAKENAVLRQIGLKNRTGNAEDLQVSLEVIATDGQQPSHLRVVAGTLALIERNPIEAEMFAALRLASPALNYDVKKLGHVGAAAQFNSGKSLLSFGEASLLNKQIAAENLVHELLHYHTAVFAEVWDGEERWKARGIKDSTIQLLQGLREKINSTMPEVKQKLDALDELRKEALQKLQQQVVSSYGESRWKNLSAQDPLYGKLFYGLGSMVEFIPHVLSDRDVIGFLSNMRYTKESKSLLEKVKEVFSQVWGAFVEALGIPRGTYMEEAVKRTLDLLLHDQIASAEALKSNTADFSMFLPQSNITTSKIDSIDRLVGKLREQRQELIDSYTGVISPKLRADKRMKLDSIDTDIQKLNEDRDMALIPAIGKKHLQWIVQVDKNPNASPNELMSAIRIGRLWEGIIQLMYDGTPSADPELAQLAANASGVIHSLLGKTKDYITEQAEGTIRPEDWSEENLSDVSPRAAYMRSLGSAAKSRVIQHIAGYIENVGRQEQEEVNRLMNELGTLEKEMLKEAGGKKELKSLYQSMMRKDGWGLTLQYSQTWFDWRRTSISKRNSHLNAIDKSEETPIVKSVKKREVWKSFWKDLHDKATFVNTNVFFEPETGKFKADIEGAKKALAELVGEDHLDIVLARAQRRYMEYVEERSAVFEALDAEVVMGDKTLEEVEVEKREYQNKNSPNVFFNNMLNSSNGSNSSGSFAAASDKYITLAPKKVSTQMWDKDYATIMDNPKKKEFYNRYQIIMDRLMSYLPKTTQENAGPGFLPIVRKAVMEDSLNVPEYVRTWQERFTRSMTASEWQIGKDKEAQRTIPIDYVYDDSLIEQRSDDLIGIARMFGMMALHYKHFSAAKDEIDMGEAILKEIHKAREGGSSQMEQNGKVVTVAQGLRNALDALQYLKEHNMQKRSRKLELGIGMKIYTENGEFNLSPIKQAAITEKIRLLLVQRADLDKRFREDQELTPDEYTVEVAKIDQELRKYEGFEMYGSKIGDKLIGINQLKALSYNPFSAVANLSFGMISAAIHANGNVDYGWKELGAAQKILAKARINSELSQKLINTMDRLGVIGDLVDSQVGKAPKVRDNQPKWKKYASPYAMLRSTDFYMKGITSVAMMLKTKVKVTVDGVEKEVSLWDSLNMEGNWDAEQFGENKSWYSEDVIEQKSWDKFRNKVVRVNMIVHGNTDKNSPKLANKFIFGRLLGQFRMSWLPEGWYSRFQKQRYDEFLGRDVKGRYKSIADIGWGASLKFYGLSLLKLLPGVHIDPTSTTLMPNGQKLSSSEVDMENMRRNFAELNFLLGITAMIWMIRGLMDDDDDKQKATMLMVNMLIRAQQDIAFYTSPGVFDAVTRNIIPATSVITDYWKFIKATNKLILDDDYEFEQWLMKLTKAGLPIPQATLINKTRFMMERNLDAFE